MLTFLEVGFGGNLVQGFRVNAWRAVPSFPQIASFPSFALRPQPLSDFNKNHLLHKLYDEEKEKFDSKTLRPQDRQSSCPRADRDRTQNMHHGIYRLSVNSTLEWKISDLDKTYLILSIAPSDKTIIGAHWLWTPNPLPNGIEKQPLMVSQWPPVLPKSGRIWSNLISNSWKHWKTAQNIGKHLWNI